MAARTTRVAVEVLNEPNPPNVRVTRVAVEVLNAGGPPTRYNIHNKAAPITPTIRGAWTGGQIATATVEMGLNKAVDGGAVTSVGGPTGGSVGQSSWAFRLVGPELDAQTISGTMNLCSPVSVGTINDGDFHWQYHVYVMTPANTVRGVLLSTFGETHPGDEWDTNTVGRINSQRTLSAVTCLDGDRIVVELGMVRRTAGATRTITFNYGGTGTDAASGVNGVGWVEFSQGLHATPPEVPDTPLRTFVAVLG